MVFVRNKFGCFERFGLDCFLFVAMIAQQRTILSVFKGCSTLHVLP